MDEQLQITVAEIDQRIRRHEWFDFHILKNDGFQLVIGGGMDLCYYHELEIIFDSVSFVSMPASEWHSDTRNPVVELRTQDLSDRLEWGFELPSGFHVFIIHPEDFKDKIYVVAKTVSFKKETVYYYERTDLKENERIADFVIRSK